MILYEQQNDLGRSSLLDSIGLSSLSPESTLWNLKNVNIDLAEVIGEPCSYFIYYGCPTEMVDQECTREEEVLYVVLTDVQHLSFEQLKKLNELGGGIGADARASYEVKGGRGLNLAVKEDGCPDKANKLSINQQIVLPGEVVKGGIADKVFNDVLQDYFKGGLSNRGKPKSHIALAGAGSAMKLELPTKKSKPQDLETTLA